MSIARLTWVLPIRKLPQHASHSQAFASVRQTIKLPSLSGYAGWKTPQLNFSTLEDAKKPLATRGHSAANRLLIADHLASHTVAILAHFV